MPGPDSDADWYELRQAARGLFDGLAEGTLIMPEPEVDHFSALPCRVAKLKGDGPRPLKTVITP